MLSREEFGALHADVLRIDRTRVFDALVADVEVTTHAAEHALGLGERAILFVAAVALERFVVPAIVREGQLRGDSHLVAVEALRDVGRRDGASAAGTWS